MNPDKPGGIEDLSEHITKFDRWLNTFPSPPRGLYEVFVEVARVWLLPDKYTNTRRCGCDPVDDFNECASCTQYIVESQCPCHVLHDKLNKALEAWLCPS